MYSTEASLLDFSQTLVLLMLLQFVMTLMPITASLKILKQERLVQTLLIMTLLVL